jgi:hypothetical protein
MSHRTTTRRQIVGLIHLKVIFNWYSGTPPPVSISDMRLMRLAMASFQIERHQHRADVAELA